jgi:hypothetical protein
MISAKASAFEESEGHHEAAKALALAVTGGDGHYANLEFGYGAPVLSARAKLRFCSGVP